MNIQCSNHNFLPIDNVIKSTTITVNTPRRHPMKGLVTDQTRDKQILQDVFSKKLKGLPPGKTW